MYVGWAALSLLIRKRAADRSLRAGLKPSPDISGVGDASGREHRSPTRLPPTACVCRRRRRATVAGGRASARRGDVAEVARRLEPLDDLALVPFELDTLLLELESETLALALGPADCH